MKFQAVDILAFDVHTAINPLANPELVKLDFRFLVDKDKYNQQYNSGLPVQANDLIISPFKKRQLFHHNHFWRNYLAMSSGSERNYWGLQIPFIYEPNNIDLMVNMQGLNFQVEKQAIVFLNSMGWSTNIKIRLTGDIAPIKLQDFVGRLYNKNDMLSLSSTFQELSHRVRGGVYISPLTVGDTLSISKHLIISLIPFNDSSDHRKYFKSEWGESPYMTDAERAKLLGILFGNQITLEQLSLNIKKVTVTRFGGTNFALTNWDTGTLLYMQESAVDQINNSASIGSILRTVLLLLKNSLEASSVGRCSQRR